MSMICRAKFLEPSFYLVLFFTCVYNLRLVVLTLAHTLIVIDRTSN